MREPCEDDLVGSLGLGERRDVVHESLVRRAVLQIRALVEQAMATLKSRRLLRKLRCPTTGVTVLIQAFPQPPASSDR
ncbi:hypothetical protein [Streptomyces sp. NPDC003401]